MNFTLNESSQCTLRPKELNNMFITKIASKTSLLTKLRHWRMRNRFEPLFWFSYIIEENQNKKLRRNRIVEMKDWIKILRIGLFQISIILSLKFIVNYEFQCALVFTVHRLNDDDGNFSNINSRERVLSLQCNIIWEYSTQLTPNDVKYNTNNNNTTYNIAHTNAEHTSWLHDQFAAL